MTATMYVTDIFVSDCWTEQSECSLFLAETAEQVEKEGRLSVMVVNEYSRNMKESGILVKEKLVTR